MDAILFSANPKFVDVKDAIDHLKSHEELYWEVPFRIKHENFEYPLDGYIHICKGQVEFKVTIQDILPFSKEHYEDKRFKPELWLREWRENINVKRWKHALVITHIEPFSCDTYDFRKSKDGEYIKKPPRNYIKVIQKCT